MERVEAHTAVSVLGPVELHVDGRLIDLGTPRQRAIIAALAASARTPVAFDTLVRRIWGDTPPATAVGTMQRYVASLRRAITPERDSSISASVLLTKGAAYVLDTTAGYSDVDRFQAGVGEARRLLLCLADPMRPVAGPAGVERVSEALRILDDTLMLWRGEPYTELGEHDDVILAERTRLHDLRAGAGEQRLIALLALGRHAETLGELETMTTLHPLHERWWALRAVALLRCGRQADALQVLGSLRELLAEELGVDPSAPLQQLYSDILRQDESLAWPTASPAPSRAIRRVVPAQRAAMQGPRWPLVGRRAESAALVRLMEGGGFGATRSALVTGEAGIGKTRLVQEVMVAAQASGTAVLVGRCSEYAPALWPFKAILQRLQAEHTDTVLGMDGGPDFASLTENALDFGTWQQIASVLREASDSSQVLLVVEDLHRADMATLLLLEHLITDHEMPGLTVVMSRRTKTSSDDQHHRLSAVAAAVARSGGQRVDLAPLTLDEAAELARVVAPDLSDVCGVAERSGGVPFFVADLALSHGRVSGSLADVVLSSVSALGCETAEALHLLSSCDGVFGIELLSCMLGVSDERAEEVLEPAVRAGLVTTVQGADLFEFAQRVVADVLSDGLTAAQLAQCRTAASIVRRGHDSREPARPAWPAQLAEPDRNDGHAAVWPSPPNPEDARLSVTTRAS